MLRKVAETETDKKLRFKKRQDNREMSNEAKPNR